MFGTVTYTIAAWLSTAAFFGGIPVVWALRRDARAAEAAGVPNARAIMTRRFFFPGRPAPLHDSLNGRIAWVDYGTPRPSREKRAVRVVRVEPSELVFEDGLAFRPRFASRGFAEGEGAATGEFVGTGKGLVVFTPQRSPLPV